MKKILITGKNSYIGTSVKNWLLKTPDLYEVDTIDLRNPEWVNEDFSKYDVVLHTAGIAHIKENKKNRELYFKVNRDLTFNMALKAKKSGIGHFIFLSSMSVYGIETGVINIDTKTTPKTAYGKSKLAAEEMISSLSNDAFKVAILRPPLVYGKGCKGNYQKISKLAQIIPVFPEVENKRSMIFIDNLSNFIKYIIDEEQFGVFYPQNNEFINTTEMVKIIAELNLHKITFTRIFNPLLKNSKVSIFNKMFGSLIYAENLSMLNYHFQYDTFKETIRKTEL